MATKRTVSVDDLGTAAGVMGVLDTLTAAAAAGEPVAVVRRVPRTAAEDRRARAQAREEAKRDEMRALINGGRTARPSKEVKVEKVEAGAATVAARTRRQRAAKVVAAQVLTEGEAEAQQQADIEVGMAALATGTVEALVTPAVAEAAMAMRAAHAERQAAKAQPKAKEPRAPRATAPVPEAGAPGTCKGWQQFGVEPHGAEALLANGRCVEHGTGAAYQRIRNTWNRTQRAQGGPQQPEQGEAVVQQPKPAQKAAETALEPVVVVDATAQQAAEHAALEAAVQAAGGPESDEGQALLAAAAAEAAAARRAVAADAKRRQRAAAKAKAAEQQ